MVLAAIAYAVYGGALQSGFDGLEAAMYGDDAILILGPSDLGHGGRIELEQPWRGAMPRLRLVRKLKLRLL